MNVRRNSNREKALEYAKGISRPTMSQRKDPVYQDETYGEDAENVYNTYGDYSYQYQNNPELDQLQNDHDNYQSEIEKIKAMFQ